MAIDIKKIGSRKIYFPNIQFSFKMLIDKKNTKEGCMMKSIIKDKIISFKELEKNIFQYERLKFSDQRLGFSD